LLGTCNNCRAGAQKQFCINNTVQCSFFHPVACLCGTIKLCVTVKRPQNLQAIRHKAKSVVIILLVSCWPAHRLLLCLAVGRDDSASKSSKQPSAGATTRKLRDRTDRHHCDGTVCGAQPRCKACNQLSRQFRYEHLLYHRHPERSWPEHHQAGEREGQTRNWAPPPRWLPLVVTDLIADVRRW